MVCVNLFYTIFATKWHIKHISSSSLLKVINIQKWSVFGPPYNICITYIYRALILFIQTLALYKSFTYLLIYLLIARYPGYVQWCAIWHSVFKDSFCYVLEPSCLLARLSPVYSDTTQLNSTQLNCQLSVRRQRVGGSERRDPVQIVCGSWRHVWCKITTKFANLCDCMTG